MKNTNIDNTTTGSQQNLYNIDNKINPYPTQYGGIQNTQNPYMMGMNQNINYGYGGNAPNYGMNNPYQQGFNPGNSGVNNNVYGQSKPPQEKIKLNYGSLQPKNKEEVR